MAPYPRWRYFPSYAPPPDWVPPLVAVFAANQGRIDSEVVHEKRMESNDVLAVLADGLAGLGFRVEQGKHKAGKLPRPVFFGDEGRSFAHTRSIRSSRPRESRLRSRRAVRPWETRSTETSSKEL
jgi:hypothetical protein